MASIAESSTSSNFRAKSNAVSLLLGTILLKSIVTALAELFAAISELLCGKIAIPNVTAASAEYLSDIFIQFREVLLSVRDSVSVFQNSAPFTPKRLEIIRAVSNAFLSLGVKPENLVTVSNMFNNYVLSFVADEYRFKNTTGDRFVEFVEKLSLQDQLIFAISQDFEGQFLYGLQLLFEGLEQVK